MYYLGTVPLPQRSGLFDVLVGTFDVSETYFLFDRTSGQLIAMEMFPDSGVDPCEVYFEDYRSRQGRLLPHQLIIRHGDDEYAEIHLDQFEFLEADPSET